MLSSLLPWKMLVQSSFNFPLKTCSSSRSFSMFSEGPLSILFYFQSYCTRLATALSFSLYISLIFRSILSILLQSMFLYIQIKNINKMYSSLYEGAKHRSIFDSPAPRLKIQPKQMQSFRQSLRKPIFENGSFYTSTKTKTLVRPNSTVDQGYQHIQFQQSVHDDFCGCQHNLVPCAIISQLLVGLNESDMRREYQRLEKGSVGRSKVQLRKKYFRYLPSYYPEIYHAQLTNILANIEQQLTVNEFLNLAWIEYHAKYEYITYFLFSDLKNAQKTKKKFFDNLEISLISYEVNYNNLIQEATASRLPLSAFLDHFHQTFAANIIPLSQYGKFIKLLLRNGCKTLTKLLVLLLTNKKDTLFDLLQYYSNTSQFRQKSRALLWQLFFQELGNKPKR